MQQQKLPLTIRKVWRQVTYINSSVIIGLTGLYLMLAMFFHWSWLFSLIGVVLIIYQLFVKEMFINKWRWARFSYSIYDEEIEIVTGVIFRSEELIPMIRIQHVETNQGPLLRKQQLKEVHIYTAASTHIIPGLAEESATHLQAKIIERVKVATEDV
ncbi:PH domain-containing protein [Brochothrix campestris]|uniref:YdbS-like PH domain-containing protein n=1 Tax=Brochothrix campestris FSL F6-1037 TaxID=1265861 RepID=W7CTW9_9LIST|nr:PH domain-containing protein [Brochothrix campestris]EUJ40155.1 hypothetical protein BCAMP_05676 [Brochothrix campestris FSL F6-1037]